MDQPKRKSILITRPTLANDLAKAGITCEETVNPFRPGYRAWYFEPSLKAKKVVAEYYGSRGLEVPASIRNRLP